MSAARRTEAAGSSCGRRQVIAFDPLDSFIASDHNLSDAITGMNLERLTAEVQQDDANLAAIAWVNGRGAVRQRDGMLQRQTAAGPDLRLETGREFNREAGRNQLRFAGRQRHGLDSMKVHPCIFVRSMSVTGNLRVFTQFTDFEAV